MSITVTSNSIPEPKPVEEKAPEKEVEESAPVKDEAETAEESETSGNEPEATEDDEEDPKEGDDKEVEDKEDDKPKKKNGFQKRLDREVRKRAELQRELERERASKRELEQRIEQAQSGQSHNAQESTNGADDEPKEEDFESHKDYVKALSRWEYRQAKKEDEAKEREAKIRAEQERMVSDFNKATEKLKEEFDDFDEVMKSTPRPPIAVELLLLESENGARLAYELGKNDEVREKIYSLSPLAAARELGKFELSVLAPQTRQEIKTTKAPAPIRPVGSKASTTRKSIYDPDLSQAEYEALRAKQ